MSDIPEAGEADLAWKMSWTAQPDGALWAELTASNISDHGVRLSGKPGLHPLGDDGTPLDAQAIVSAEGRLPAYVVLDPCESASAQVEWAGWDGPDPSGDLAVRWPGGQATIRPDGPKRPPAAGPATNLSSSWFRRL